MGVRQTPVGSPPASPAPAPAPAPAVSQQLQAWQTGLVQRWQERGRLKKPGHSLEAENKRVSPSVSVWGN